MFGEVARAMMEDGFVHPRPPAIPKYRVGFEGETGKKQETGEDAPLDTFEQTLLVILEED